jgi:cytochrome P450
MTQMSLADRFFVDAMSAAFREDSYPYYETYRGRERLLRADDTIWLSLGHADVTGMLRHPKLSSNESRATTETGCPDPGRPAGSLLFMDPPDHTRLRRLVACASRRSGSRTSGQRPRRSPRSSSTRPQPRACPDLIRSLAYPLPVRIICSLLGVPEADEATFTGWSRALARSLDPTVLRSAEVDAAIADAESGLAAYLEDLLAIRRTRPADDLLSALLDVEADGERISRDEGAADERR